MMYFYLTAIRPVLEYGCAVWHYGLTAAQSQKLESLQKRALTSENHPPNCIQYAIMNPHVDMLKYNPSLLGGLNWGEGSFARPQYPTAVYMTVT